MNLITLNNQSQTIVAPATALITSAIAIIRLSGSESYTIASKLSHNKLKKTPRYSQLLSFYIDNELIDQGLITYYCSPQSYTGEDMIEINSHGSLVIVGKIIEFCLEQGAILAQGGEFTKRSFLNGKMDLIQAESVIHLIESKNYYQVKALQKNLQGQLSKEFNTIVDELKKLRILLEANIDFSTEDILATDREDLKQKISTNIDVFKNIQLKTKDNQLLKNQITILIAGKPNAGKSSIFNQLIAQNKAIVTELAGTTRDLIDETISIGGIPVKFIDSAGIRFTQDKIEQAGIEKTKQAVEQADYIFWINDLSDSKQDFMAQIKENISTDKISKTILIHNKCDLLNETTQVLTSNLLDLMAQIQMSIEQKEGVYLIKQALLNKLKQNEDEEAFFINQHQAQILNQSIEYLEQAYYEMSENDFIELAAENVKMCLQNLEMIIGNYSNEELLGDIFSKFCIGK